MERRISKIEIYDKDFWNNLEKLRHILLIFSRKDRDETNSCSTSLISGNKEEAIAVNSDSLSGSKDTEKYSKVHLLEKIKKIFKEFVSSQDGRKTLAVPDRKTWKNTNFEKDCGIQLIKNPVLKTVGKYGPASTKRLIMLQHLLTKIYKLIETDSYKTKRELYYEDVNLFKSQSIVDNLLDDIACLLNVSKTHLHVLTTSKGCIAGILRFKDAEGNYIDCSETARGILIPNNVQDITNIQSEARFIMVIEKSAVFEMVIDNDILSFFHPCILITGKGFPDVNTREMLRKLFDSLQIPILGLFDADPYGIEIFGTYKYGSKETFPWPGNSPDMNPIENLWAIVKKKLKKYNITNKTSLIETLIQIWHHDNEIQMNCQKLIQSMPRQAMAFDVGNLAVPEMRWLGLLPTDIQRLHLPAESTMPLSENDKKKANQLLNLPYIQHHQLWLNEVQVMLKMEKKAEIEGLSKINPVFLPSIYLPNKIKYGGWI